MVVNTNDPNIAVVVVVVLVVATPPEDDDDDDDDNDWHETSTPAGGTEPGTPGWDGTNPSRAFSAGSSMEPLLLLPSSVALAFVIVVVVIVHWQQGSPSSSPLVNPSPSESVSQNSFVQENPLAR